jgi:hypothetical protein
MMPSTATVKTDFPARGHSLDAVGQGVHFLAQPLGFSEQLFAGLCGLGLSAAAVKQQNVQSVLNLA